MIHDVTGSGPNACSASIEMYPMLHSGPADVNPRYPPLLARHASTLI